MRQSHRLYVGTIGEGLWRSRDGGETFVRAMDGMFVECHVRALAEHPREPGRLYLGCEQGLFRSDDGAGNWARVKSPLNGLQIWSLLLLPHDPAVPDTVKHPNVGAVFAASSHDWRVTDEAPPLKVPAGVAVLVA